MRFRFFLPALFFYCTQSLNLPRGVYIHIPFCRRRCFYCNFPVVVIGERPSTQLEQGSIYTSLLLREIRSTVMTTDETISELETVYFGGGTPSLLPIECIVQILTELKSSMGFAPNAEITLEMDPGTFDMKKLSQLSEAGISRLSLGVQSFDSKILESAGRAHTVDDVTRALELVLSSNFRDNFSIDLISSLPGLSIDLWQETLEKASASGCSHVSVYDLQVEDKTAFGRWYSPGVFPLPSDEISANMFCRATEVLKASGFEHYEVSNYARQGKRSQHNQRYWNCKPTWGFGMGAASFIANNRYTRPDRMIEYTKWVTELELMGFTGSTTNIDDDFEDASLSLDENNPGDKSTDLILFDGIVNPTGATDILEVVMLALRTSDGLNLTELGNLYGEISVEKVIKAVLPFQERGLVEMKDIVDVASNNAETDLQSTNLLSRIVCLTDPEGFLLSNDIISSVFVELTC